VDEVVFHVVQEPLTAWLLFLQGNLDLTGLSSDNHESVIERGATLTPELEARGIRLIRTPRFQINYVAFNDRDPVLGTNLALRRAISLAYDVQARVEMSNHQLLPAKGPIPAGVAGYDPDLDNPYARYDLAAARKLLARAGYPDGIDPATGESLVLQFDLGGTDITRRRQAEMMVKDMEKLGIRVEPTLNNWPRFLQKIRNGDVQLFQIAWIGDYPDGQNFLQLFYGPNAGSCNRAYYRNPEFDALYEQAVNLAHSPERTELYRQMQELLVDDCPWIFESFPVSFRLVQPWLEGYIPHDFACDTWKYVDLDPERLPARRAGE
jgi:ABC-type transport system substrate-binding protein